MMNKLILKLSTITVFLSVLLVLSGCTENNTTPSDTKATAAPVHLDITVQAVDGEFLLKSGNSWRSIDADAELKVGDIIRTGKEANVTLNLNGSGLVYLAEDTEIKITGANLFDQHYGKVIYLAKSNSFEVDALGHYFKSLGTFAVSVNLSANRVNAKALKSSLDTIARFPDVNELPQTISEGEEITFDPANSNLVFDNVIPGDYYNEAWFSSVKNGNPEYFAEEAEAVAEEPFVSESAAEATPPSVKTPSTKKTTSSSHCRPSISAKKDNTYKGILLYWTKCNSDDFQFYKIVKSSTNINPVYPGDSVVTSSSNSSMTNSIDKTVAPNRTYFYRACVVHRLAKVTCGAATSASY